MALLPARCKITPALDIPQPGQIPLQGGEIEIEIAADPIFPRGCPIHFISTSQRISRRPLVAQLMILVAAPAYRAPAFSRPPGPDRTRQTILSCASAARTVLGIPSSSACQACQPAMVTTRRLAQYESPGCPCCSFPHLLISSCPRLPTGSDSGQSGKESSDEQQ